MKLDVISEKDKYYLFTLSKDDLTVEITNLGGIIKSIKYKGIDVALGFDTVEEYTKIYEYYGATIGRVCNRIENAQFILNGEKYTLNPNNGANCLHGGKKSFNRVVWDYEVIGEKLALTYLSPDKEEGFPGNLKAKVVFGVSDNGLSIEYFAESDKDTICNLTNHTFFNLNGEGNGDVLSHLLQIDSDKILENNEKLIPTGNFVSVEKTPYDFNKLTAIGERINQDNIQLKYAGGYDNAYVLNGSGLRKVATLIGDKTDIQLDVFTDQPSLQVYSGNFLRGGLGKGGKPYVYRSAVCLETQGYPNAVNRPNFPSVVLKKGEKYYTKTIYTFKDRK